jgi:hypothetical protein
MSGSDLKKRGRFSKEDVCNLDGCKLVAGYWCEETVGLR